MKTCSNIQHISKHTSSPSWNRSMSERVASRCAFMFSMSDVYDVTLCLAWHNFSLSSTRLFSCTQQPTTHWSACNTTVLTQFTEKDRRVKQQRATRDDENTQVCLTSTTSSSRNCPTSPLSLSTVLCSRSFSDISWSRRCLSHSICRWRSSSWRAA